MNATSGSAALALAIAMFASGAFAANPSPTDVATARELYKQGADALDAGNAALAVDRLDQAWSLVHTPVIGLDLARAQSTLGHLVEAREAALSVQRLPIGHDETARSTEARNDAAKIATQLEPRIPHVTVTVEGLAGHEATVKLDGSVVPAGGLAVARQANPGNHIAIVDTDDGRHAESTITLAERETKSIVLQLDAPKTPVVVHPTTVTPVNIEPHPLVSTEPHDTRTHLSPLVWIGIAVGGVGLATGAISGAFAVSESNIVQANCGQTAGPDGKKICRPPYTGDLDAANTLSTVSTVAFIVGGVGVAVLVTGLALGSHTNTARTGAKIVPFFGPVSGLRGEF